jgi:thymidylate kinase
MIYIFEGVDLVGKSSIAQAFADKYSIPLIKKRFDVLDEGQTRKFLSTSNIENIQKFFWLSIWPLRKYDFVVDRALLSSLTYGTFFKREFDKSYIYDALKDEDVTVFFVHADKEIIEQRKAIRTEKLFNIDEIIKIQGMYFDVISVLLEQNAIKNLEIINNSYGSINANIPSIK